MMIAQVPSMLQFHEEYFVNNLDVPLVSNQSSYEIPDRAIGMKLRGLFWVDENGNIYEMTRVNAEDKAYFQRFVGANTTIQKFYLEGNNVILLPPVQDSPTGSLRFNYFLRPNQLVRDSNAATVVNFIKTLTIGTLVSGNTITIDDVVFTAGTDFVIGGTSIITATNLVAAINTNGIASASNGTVSTNIVAISYSDISVEFSTSNAAQCVISTNQGINFNNIPSNITNSSLVDFLQTKVGHKTRKYDVTVPSNGISGTTITFASGQVPSDMLVGDYVCTANECIIPQIPTDLHNALAERTSARILASLGDVQGLQTSNAKIQEIEARQGNLLDQRVEGSPKKVLARHTTLRYSKYSTLRRL